jgi:hypothetical protein
VLFLCFHFIGYDNNYDGVPLTSPITAELKLQSLKNDGCGPFSVIKIVKMKYKRIDIK